MRRKNISDPYSLINIPQSYFVTAVGDKILKNTRKKVIDSNTHRANRLADKLRRMKGVRVLEVLGTFRSLIIACSEKNSKRIGSMEDVEDVMRREDKGNLQFPVAEKIGFH